MSLHVKLAPDALQKLHAQRRISTISSILIALLVVILISFVLALFLLSPFVKEAPIIVTYQSSQHEEKDMQENKVQTNMARKPSAPSSSVTKVIAANTLSSISIPVPDTEVTTLALAFGDGDDFGDGWGGSGSGDGSGFTFFGKKSESESVVFVFDISGSMIMGNRTPETYEVLEKEISKAISQLNESTTFGVIAFSRGADSYKKKLVRAESDEKEKAIKWLEDMSPVPPNVDKDKPLSQGFFANFAGGRHQFTRSDLALMAAMELDPETIIYISDGEPTCSVPKLLTDIAEIQKEKKRPVKIDAVAYMTKQGLAFMEKLAKENNGEFREVDPTNSSSKRKRD